MKVPKAPDIAGLRFGRLTVVARVGSDNNGNSRWLCSCDCGEQRNVLAQSLRNGATRSCGCLNREIVAKRETRHGQTGTSTYRTWDAMLQRCTNPKHRKWPDYGGRGIQVCESWKKYEDFFSDMGARPDGMTIDRIDNDGDYTPENCRWATPTEQMNNRRNNRVFVINGERLTLSQACRKFQINKSTARNRLSRGMDIEAAMEVA